MNAAELMTDDEWSSVIDTNLSSVFKFCRAAHPALATSPGGKIINIGSMYSLFGSPFAASYAASNGQSVAVCGGYSVS